MSRLDEDQWPCLEDARHVGSSGTFNLPTKGTSISSIKPAPDPIPNLSPLGGEQISTATSKFSFDLYADAVDRDASAERFSVKINLREDKQGIQGHIIPKLVDHKDKLVHLRIIQEAPNHLHDQENSFTYNKIVNHIQRENKEHTVVFVRFVSHDHG
jgi:hypothetical protein